MSKKQGEDKGCCDAIFGSSTSTTEMDNLSDINSPLLGNRKQSAGSQHSYRATNDSSMVVNTSQNIEVDSLGKAKDMSTILETSDEVSRDSPLKNTTNTAPRAPSQVTIGTHASLQETGMPKDHVGIITEITETAPAVDILSLIAENDPTTVYRLIKADINLLNTPNLFRAILGLKNPKLLVDVFHLGATDFAPYLGLSFYKDFISEINDIKIKRTTTDSKSHITTNTRDTVQSEKDSNFYNNEYLAKLSTFIQILLVSEDSNLLKYAIEISIASKELLPSIIVKSQSGSVKALSLIIKNKQVFFLKELESHGISFDFKEFIQSLKEIDKIKSRDLSHYNNSIKLVAENFHDYVKILLSKTSLPKFFGGTTLIEDLRAHFTAGEAKEEKEEPEAASYGAVDLESNASPMPSDDDAKGERKSSDELAPHTEAANQYDVHEHGLPKVPDELPLVGETDEHLDSN